MWDRLFGEVRGEADAVGEIDWEIYYVDGTIVCALKYAAEAEGDLHTEVQGWSSGDFTAKIHICAEGKGRPVVIILTPGQRHEGTVFEQQMETGAIKRAGPTQATTPPDCLRQGLQSSPNPPVPASMWHRGDHPTQNQLTSDRSLQPPDLSQA